MALPHRLHVTHQDWSRQGRWEGVQGRWEGVQGRWEGGQGRGEGVQGRWEGVQVGGGAGQRTVGLRRVGNDQMYCHMHVH